MLIFLSAHATVQLLTIKTLFSTRFQDEKEMIRNLASAMDGPEALVDADEYLQPKSRAPIPPGLSASNTSGSPPNTPVKVCWPNGKPLAADSPTPQNQQNWDRELLRYGANHRNGNVSHEPGNSGQHPHFVTPNGHCGHPVGSDSSSSRYCSDPLKMISVRGEF